MKKSILYAFSALTLMACGEATTTNNKASDSKDSTDQKSNKELVCKKVYDAENTKIGFGGFKTSDKKEVKGYFRKFTVGGTKEGETGAEVFGGASINIPVSSVETKDAGRNERIVSAYFGSLTAGERITATIKSINGDTAVVDVNLNDISKTVNLSYAQVGDTVKLEGNIDVVALFDAQAAVDGLNKVCEALHKGADGVSKTWPDVNIHVYSVLKEECK